MDIFHEATGYHGYTGTPIKRWEYKETRCDYTGEVVDEENTACLYRLDYGDHDPCFGVGFGENKLYNICKDAGKKLNLADFLSEPYSFLNTDTHSGDIRSAEAEMFMELMKQTTEDADEKNAFHGCYTFSALCRAARTRTALRLIEEKIITPNQLSRE